MSKIRVVSLSELEDTKKWLESGETGVQVPLEVSYKSYAQSLRKFLSISGEVPTICKIDDNELYVRLIGE